MALLTPARQYPPNVTSKMRARNGVAPDWRTGLNTAERLNFVMAHCRKAVFTHSELYHGDFLPSVVAAQTTCWRHYFQTGHASANAGDLELIVIAVVAPTTSTSATNPRWRYNAKLSGGGTVTSDWVYHSEYKTAGNSGFSDLTYQTTRITVTGNSTYEGYFEVDDYSRLTSVCVYEMHPRGVEHDDAGVTDSRLYADGESITDSQHTNLVAENPHELWKRNGAPLFQWVPDGDYEGAVGTASTAFLNLLNGAVTAWSATSPGWTLNTQSLAPLHDTGITVRFCAYAAGGGEPETDDGEVRLVDTDGTLATLGQFDEAGEWLTTLVNIDGTAATEKLDVQYRSVSEGITVYAVCMFLMVQ